MGQAAKLLPLIPLVDKSAAAIIIRCELSSNCRMNEPRSSNQLPGLRQSGSHWKRMAGACVPTYEEIAHALVFSALNGTRIKMEKLLGMRSCV